MRGFASVDCIFYFKLLESFIRVDEFGLIYNQSVNLDMETMEVIEHVPQHERDGRLFEDTVVIENQNLVQFVFFNFFV